MKKNLESGITLVSLVITIVIMLILAGVSISFIVGSNGLFNKSKQSANKYQQASEKEKSELEKAADDLDSLYDDNTNVAEGTPKEDVSNNLYATNGGINVYNKGVNRSNWNFDNPIKVYEGNVYIDDNYDIYFPNNTTVDASGNPGAYVECTTPIDLTSVNTIYVAYDCKAITTTQTYRFIQVGVDRVQRGAWGDNTWIGNMVTSAIIRPSTDQTNAVAQIDVSSLSGNYFISISNQGTEGAIHAIWYK